MFDRATALWQRINRVDISLIAAGIAFFGFLAIFPAIAAVIAIWGFAFDPGVIQSQLALTRNYLPAEAFDLLTAQVARLLAANSRDLGLTTIISTTLALWSSRAGVGALIGGLNSIHGYPGRNGFWHLIRAIVLTFALVGLALSALALAVVVPLVIGFLPIEAAKAATLEAVNFGLGLSLVMLAIALTYLLGPNRPAWAPRPPILTRGLFVAVVLWAIVSRGLVFYFANFGSYNHIYGSIGAVVALMFWFYGSAFAVLLGAALDAEHTHRLHAPKQPESSF